MGIREDDVVEDDRDDGCEEEGLGYYMPLDDGGECCTFSPSECCSLALFPTHVITVVVVDIAILFCFLQFKVTP